MRRSPCARGFRERAGAPRLLAGLALALPGCTAVLDVDGYEFAGAGGTQQQTPVLPLEPIAEEGEPDPMPPPDSTLLEPEPEPVIDAGSKVPDDGGSPPVEPPPAEPLPRPVVVGEPEPLVQLAGSPTGGQPRSAICPGGVMYGLYFQYYTSVSLEPDRLSYAWPVCSRLEPSTPNLRDGEAYEASWPISTLDDPVFAPLRANEGIDSIICPADQYMVGIEGSYDEPVVPSVAFRSLGVRCAALNTDVERSDVVQGPLGIWAGSGIAPVAGLLPFAQQCPAGQAANQLELRFGNWLDAIGLRCSVVRWPFTAGHACATPNECQSGVCGGDGLCAP